MRCIIKSKMLKIVNFQENFENLRYDETIL